MSKYAGKKAVVTGGTAGIGLATVKALLSVKVCGCNHIAIEVSDAGKAVASYQDVFNLEKLDGGSRHDVQTGHRTPMIATTDVGEKAAELLTEQPFLQPRVREVLRPRDYTMAEATCILGSATGKPKLEYGKIS